MSNHSSIGTTRSSALDQIFLRCEGAYSENTIRGYRNDLKHFQAWCAKRNQNWLPAEPQTVADFIDAQLETKAIATIKHRVDAIKFAHRMAEQDAQRQRCGADR